VFDAYQAIIRTGDYKVGDLACYIPPDNILPDKPEYAFLKGKLRIKAQRLRGIVSQGLVIPAPDGAQEGDDVAEQIGLTHYIPHMVGQGGVSSGFAGDYTSDPPFAGRKYDIDSWFRYSSTLEEGTPVEISEKIHGANVRASYQNGKYWMGSRNFYRKQSSSSLYWKVLNRNKWLKRLCKNNPDCVVYGETFGWIQNLKYGATKPDTFYFRVFDILTQTGYMGYKQKMEAMAKAMIPSWWEDTVSFFKNLFSVDITGQHIELVEDHYVPIYYVGPYTKALVELYMSGHSLVPGANHLREGCVIKPLDEMWHPHVGRLILKAVSPDYLEHA
jgi:RNA ligase (TIGR02306 family)